MKAGRLKHTLGAQVYNQTVNLGVQIALAPVLLWAWGIEIYGIWLLLVAIPTYLTFTDLGFTFSAKNAMSMMIARGDQGGALRVYQSVFILLVATTVGVVFVLFCLGFAFQPSVLFMLGEVSDQDAYICLALLSANVILYQFLLLDCGAMRSVGRPAIEVIWVASSRLIEGAATAATALFGQDLVAAAFAIFACRLILVMTVHVRLKKIAPWATWGSKQACLRELRIMLSPSLSIMCASFSQALLIQGPVVLLGMQAEPSLVAMFSMTRTLSRIGTSFASVVSFAVVPEYSIAYGQADKVRFGYLLKMHLLAVALIASLYLLAMLAFGPLVLNIWTGGRIQAAHPFFDLLVFAAVFEIACSALFAPISATNQHVRLGYLFLGVSVVAVGLVWLSISCCGLEGVGGILLATQLVLLVLTAMSLREWMPRAF